MSNIIQASSVHGLTTTLTVSNFLLESLNLQDILDVNFSSASVVQLTKYPTPYFIRQDKKNKKKTVKVFNGNGEQVFTFERLSCLNPVWRMLTFPARQEVATIKIGLTSRSVDFHTKEGITHRDVFLDIGLNGRYRSFYLNDGYKYSWSSSTKYLEKVINPNGKLEETRLRVAKVKLMRQFKLDFEILVDEDNIDPEIALSTAFISMFTQWGTGNYTDTIGPTFIPPKPIAEEVEPEEQQDKPITLVIENPDGSNLQISSE
ncbi:uncharacterized protein SPAPADRAFT_146037 [Spathaspora passalidarum NRRL Y-27907]|uniref:Uncharacterized protein n=1 Tax=Spathaspora passalidarum (strain NRRL Y-27907 / 11-Y1) TaxID=619300 RepID=G3AFY9_SPAPN|nr:uncharacterized protein SPAPADRAFT_146037 [Spathaspora passalidarum NRRL Y-27907]EGW35128.1 hypothetical protein SPAPADRAFT_146037 [Spathaspora passalidarum NRRL Y-27907]